MRVFLSVLVLFIISHLFPLLFVESFTLLIVWTAVIVLLIHLPVLPHPVLLAFHGAYFFYPHVYLQYFLEQFCPHRRAGLVRCGQMVQQEGAFVDQSVQHGENVVSVLLDLHQLLIILPKETSPGLVQGRKGRQLWVIPALL